MIPGVHLREFSYPEDYAAVYQLWKEAGTGIHVGFSDTFEEIGKKLRRDPDLFLLACAGERIIASVMGGFDGRRGMVYHLAVDQGYRGRGIGSVLMDELEARLRAKGCRKYYLLVTEDNLDVISFYEKRGWERMAILPYGKVLG